ncbi:hypothetical protein BDK51DRAFT_39253 [Blyttiomyces helicus]|uniref:Uncharacterized protein n=1 Tax=Blyttiomyces helicus TaxID=388810 RepID=A0A4P9W946_9FUNG|nr:hypothetical protein BDK51DRAFT_39253 [Blyttiomyces helicus]|eukprot:RKO88672.1 hypothetical protein BDK51DRAFT_39253 [Blyttiomyces helicus]
MPRGFKSSRDRRQLRRLLARTTQTTITKRSVHAIVEDAVVNNPARPQPAIPACKKLASPDGELHGNGDRLSAIRLFLHLAITPKNLRAHKDVPCLSANDDLLSHLKTLTYTSRNGISRGSCLRSAKNNQIIHDDNISDDKYDKVRLTRMPSSRSLARNRLFSGAKNYLPLLMETLLSPPTDGSRKRERAWAKQSTNRIAAKSAVRTHPNHSSLFLNASKIALNRPGTLPHPTLPLPKSLAPPKLAPMDGEIQCLILSYLAHGPPRSPSHKPGANRLPPSCKLLFELPVFTGPLASRHVLVPPLDSTLVRTPSLHPLDPPYDPCPLFLSQAPTEHAYWKEKVGRSLILRNESDLAWVELGEREWGGVAETWWGVSQQAPLQTHGNLLRVPLPASLHGTRYATVVTVLIRDHGCIPLALYRTADADGGAVKYVVGPPSAVIKHWANSCLMERAFVVEDHDGGSLK